MTLFGALYHFAFVSRQVTVDRRLSAFIAIRRTQPRGTLRIDAERIFSCLRTATDEETEGRREAPMSAHAGNIPHNNAVAPIFPSLEIRTRIERAINGLAVLVVYGTVMMAGAVIFIALYPFARFGTHARRKGRSAELAKRSL
jgi:hypothetical protein